MACQVRAHPSFCSMKGLRVFLLRLDGTLVHLYLYTFGCMQRSHQDFALGSRRTPLQKNRGPVRMLEGQDWKLLGVLDGRAKNLSWYRVVQIIWACTPKGFLHEVRTWSNMFTIAYNLIEMLTQTFTTYMWPTRLKAIKVKALSSLLNVFIHLNKQNAGVFDWPLNYS